MKSLVMLLAASLAAAPTLAERPKLNLDSQITVSGISSGGYMAGQFHLAHSTIVDGAAIIAAGPWNCARNNLGQALASCVDKTEPAVDLAVLTADAQQLAQAGKIDPLASLRGDKVWLLHGTLDTKVAPALSEQLRQQYASWLNSADLVYLNDLPFHHTFPTLNAGSDCTASEPPYLGRCNYDAAGELLGHLLGPMNPAADNAGGTLHTIDQQAMGGDSADAVADQGFVYIPAQCAKGESCKLHISFHGCQQNAEALGDRYAREAGFNRWADTNNLVILYPQTRKSLFAPLNPKACWDWWGYTGDDYATKTGAQIRAVKAMSEALTRP